MYVAPSIFFENATAGKYYFIILTPLALQLSTYVKWILVCTYEEKCNFFPFFNMLIVQGKREEVKNSKSRPPIRRSIKINFGVWQSKPMQGIKLLKSCFLPFTFWWHMVNSTRHDTGSVFSSVTQQLFAISHFFIFLGHLKTTCFWPFKSTVEWMDAWSDWMNTLQLTPITTIDRHLSQFSFFSVSWRPRRRIRMHHGVFLH